MKHYHEHPAVRALKLTAIFIVGQYLFFQSLFPWQEHRVLFGAGAIALAFLFFWIVESE